MQNKEKCGRLECASSFITNLPLYLAEKTIELLQETALTFRCGAVPFAVRLSKESAQGAHNLGTEDHQVDNHDTDEHHHGVTLDLLGALGRFLF